MATEGDYVGFFIHKSRDFLICNPILVIPRAGGESPDIVVANFFKKSLIGNRRLSAFADNDRNRSL
jgi:hypothetical protein